VAKRLDGSRLKQHGGKPRQWLHYVRWDPAPAPPKRGHSSPPSATLLSHVLWPNGSMDQDATWYGGGPWPRPPVPPQKRVAQPPNFWLVCCGQTAGWIQMPHDTEVGLGAGNIVLGGGPSSPLKWGTSPTSHPMSCG